MVRVTLIHHARQAPVRQYAIGLVADAWRERGIEVVDVFGPPDRIEADIAVLHVDLTIVPTEYLDALASVPVVVNARLTDISKRAFSRLVLRRGDAWDGPAIVKTNLNCGGGPEMQYVGRTRPRDPWRFLPLALSRRLRPRIERMSGDYRVYASSSDVPDASWDDASLVVERFVAERDGDAYVVRRCHFLGDRAVNTRYRSTEQVARGHTMTDPQRCDPPEELWRIREELGADYARLDYGIVDGAVVLYDVNRTPSIARPTPRLVENARELAPGIDQYLARLRA